MSKASLTVRAPGKLILSGEHAVVYGNPALAIAIDKFATTTIKPNDQIFINLPKVQYKETITLDELYKLKKRLEKSSRPLLYPYQLCLYAIISTIDKYIKNFAGFELTTTSDIPIGCGLGSSAAVIVSIMYAITKLFNIDISLEAYAELGREIENLQHGNSSGLDINVSLKGGNISIKSPIYIINTGKPYSTTRQCVEHAAKYLKKDKILLKDFATITNDFAKALQDNNLANIKECIRNNHRLLCRIGVVPDKVQQFVERIEKTGGAAKISGAGAVDGDNAGIVLVVADIDINPIVEKYNYKRMPIKGSNKGVQVV